MQLLLDTHVWLWSLMEPERLGARAAAQLLDEKNQVFLSPISVWETLVLIQKGRLQVEHEAKTWIERALVATGATEASLTAEIAIASRFIKLPHDDPADRFLAATAHVMDLKLVTADKHLLKAKACSLLQA
jgi:PIN domain nuclease of toxin-antitoxin system